MANAIKVTPEELINMSQRLENWVDSYDKCYRNILGATQELADAWGGDARDTYLTQVQGFENDFQNLYTLFNQYGTYLRQTARKYLETEENIKQAAGQINTGI